MDNLSIDTVPLTVLPSTAGVTFVIRIDEPAGRVHLDPTSSQPSVV